MHGVQCDVATKTERLLIDSIGIVLFPCSLSCELHAGLSGCDLCTILTPCSRNFNSVVIAICSAYMECVTDRKAGSW